MTDTTRATRTATTTAAAALVLAAVLPVLVLALASGCKSGGDGPVAAGAPTPDGEPSNDLRRASYLAHLRAASANKGRDVPDPLPALTRMDVYHLVVPYGTVSRNEAFWRRVDEQCVGVATYDVLFKNGVRVGMAPASEYPYFRDLLAEHPVETTPSVVVGEQGKDIDIEVRKAVDSQTIFHYDASNTLRGRTYDRCENFVVMNFQPAPRKPGHVRVALCPVVKAVRQRLEYTLTNNREFEVTYTRPERLYDVNLRADVPPDGFLIVAPSDQAAWPTSIGHNFLVHDGAAERTESVLLIVPRLVSGEVGE
jgi:hypothetical protein